MKFYLLTQVVLWSTLLYYTLTRSSIKSEDGFVRAFVAIVLIVFLLWPLALLVNSW